MRRPNVLLIYTDQLRWDALGCNGNPDVKTPNLDRLAGDGLTFRRHFVQNPVCMPSRVSFLTGQYPSALGITHMGVPVPPETVTLPSMLRPYGYVSANIGKLHFLPHANRDHRQVHPNYGFDVLEISDEPGPYEDAYRAWVRRIAPEHLDAISPGLPPMAETWNRALGIRDAVVHPKERFPKHAIPFRAPGHLTHSAFVAEQAMEFIRHVGAGASGGHTQASLQRGSSDSQAGSPWLCIASFYSPHSPWVAPQEFLDLYDPSTFRLPSFPAEVDGSRAGTDYSEEGLRAARHGYYAMISEVDHHVGRLLSLVEETGKGDDTIVVFTSDHGDWLGEHLRHGKGYPAADPVSRVPLLMRWPGSSQMGGSGIKQPGRPIDEIVEAVDVLPTLLECAAVPVPPQVQGRSLLPYLQARPAAARESALTEAHGWKALRTERYRYVYRVTSSGPEEHLWELESDPGEYDDLAARPEHAAALAEHRRLLLARVLENEQPLPRVWAY
ncbi:MAG TPA: sulfatase-like hydrolase/transferase [Chloroflexota bacterium]|nr:sulfatase-like hydrolase/transferase [Chloroflexota bacterium]